MFDIGWSEMALVLLVALIVIGPKDLPRVARTMGQWVGKGRAMAREFQRALEDMAREAELDKVKSEIEKAGRTNFGKTIEKTIDPSGELGKAFDPAADAGPAAGKRANGDQSAGARPAPAKSGKARATPAKPASARATPAKPVSAPAQPANAEERARAGNGAEQPEDRKEPARATAPAEPS